MTIAFLLALSLTRPAHLVVAEGSGNADEGRGALSLHDRTGFPVPEGLTVLESAKVKGLKPGFFIVAPGLFDTEAEALALRDFVRHLGVAAYVRAVDVQAPAHKLVTVVRSRLEVAFAGGVAELPVTGLEVRDCATKAPLGRSGTGEGGKAVIPYVATGKPCLAPLLSSTLVSSNGLEGCKIDKPEETREVVIRCTSKLPPPERTYKTVFITDLNTFVETSEDWDSFIADITTSLAGSPIAVNSASNAQTFVDAQARGRVVARVSVAGVARGPGAGYLFVQSGKRAKFVPHNMPDQIIEAARQFFEIPSLQLKYRNRPAMDPSRALLI